MEELNKFNQNGESLFYGDESLDDSVAFENDIRVPFSTYYEKREERDSIMDNVEYTFEKLTPFNHKGPGKIKKNTINSARNNNHFAAAFGQSSENIQIMTAEF